MRDIRFRAWHKSSSTMLERVDRDFESLASYVENDAYEVMQYTGLKDKSGVEIYEGDVLSLFDPRTQTEHKKKLSAVTFNNGAFLVDTQMGASPNRTTMETLYRYLMWREYSECEVIGNVWENPELLK